jgi:hypothetical protein
MGLATCPQCYTTTTIDGDNGGMVLGITLVRVVILGGGALLIGSWMFGPTFGLIVGVIVGGMQLMNGGWAVSTGATTCHACGMTFQTR